MAWLNLTMPNQTVKNALQAKKIKLPQMNFFLEKQLKKFSYTYWSLSFCKILKKFLGLLQSYEDVPFSGPKWLFVKSKIFWCKQLLLLSSTYWPFSLCKILKKLLQRIQSYEDASSLGPKSSFAPNKFFFENNYWYHFQLPIGPFHSAKFLKNS